MKTTTFFLIFPLATLICHGQTEARAPLQLSLKRAIELGTSTEGNASVQIAAEAVQIAKAKSNEVRADLLPELEGSLSVQSMTRNLSAMGIRSEGPLADIGIPRTVGPFRVFDARITSSQKVLDMGAIRRFQSSKVTVRAEQSSRNATVDQAAAAIAKSYVAALRAGAELEAIEANVALAQALMVQAERQERGGIGTGVEVTRAKVQLANEQQRKIAASNEFTRTKLELLRAMGRSLDLDIELTDKLNLSPPGTDNAQAFRQALTRRSDWKAQLDSERAAELTSSATRMDRLPSVSAYADYGSIGSGLDAATPSRTYGIALKIPVYDGGRRQAKVSASSAKMRQEKIRTKDLHDQIELEVRVAMDALHSAEEQVKVAEEGIHLAEKEFAQSRKRYEVGVTNSLEVTEAQTRLARARDNRVLALYNHNLARIALGEATGTILEIGD